MTKAGRSGRFTRYAGALAALTVAGLVQATPAHAVANGEDVPDGKYRFATSLSMPKITRPDGSTYASACSAALIDPQWIITAGHCFHDGARNRVSGPPRYQVVATVGQATLSGTDGTKVEVVDVVQGEKADVAIAKLRNPVRHVQPLPVGAEQPKPNDVVRLTGWGSRDKEADLTHRPDRMQTGQFLVTRVEANEVFVAGYAPQPTTSACPYDSGAPLFAEGKHGPRLVSTEVTGPDCPHDQDETTARTDVLRSWIHEHINARR